MILTLLNNNRISTSVVPWSSRAGTIYQSPFTKSQKSPLQGTLGCIGTFINEVPFKDPFKGPYLGIFLNDSSQDDGGSGLIFKKKIEIYRDF